MSSLSVPVSVLLSLWAPLPSSRGVVVAGAGPRLVRDQRTGALVPLGAWLDAVRPLRRCAALLPVPGDGLPGGVLAGDRGQAVLLESAADPAGTAVVLVPQGDGEAWRADVLEAVVPPLDAAQLRREVHLATEEAIAALTGLDLARERPELADELTDLVTAVVDPRLLPPMPSRRRDLLERSLRLAGLCERALEDDGAAASAAQAARRADVLRPLLAVARRGVCAATEWWA